VHPAVRIDRAEGAPVLVGLTYDLRSEYAAEGFSDDEIAEFDRDDTIDAIERALVELGYRTDRIGRVTKLVERLARGDRWDIVFNVAEGMRGRSREAQIPALLDAYGIPYTFSDAVVLAVCLDKALTKRVLRDSGVATTDFALLCEAHEAHGVTLALPLFAKPVAEGTSKGISSKSRVESLDELECRVGELLQAYAQPVLVEPFLPGREFTVGVIGSGARARAIGTMEIVLRSAESAGTYARRDKEECDELVEYRLADDVSARAAAEVALAAWRALECRDAGRVDVRLDAAGTPNVIEINPLAGLHPQHSDLPILALKAGIGFVPLVDAIMRSACERSGLLVPEPMSRGIA
jgi:D-alanine-D-alanine ligase